MEELIRSTSAKFVLGVENLKYSFKGDADPATVGVIIKGYTHWNAIQTMAFLSIFNLINCAVKSQ